MSAISFSTLRDPSDECEYRDRLDWSVAVAMQGHFHPCDEEHGDVGILGYRENSLNEISDNGTAREHEGALSICIPTTIS